MSFLSKLLGSREPKSDTKSEQYEGYTITPTPAKDGTRYRIGARIEKDVDGVAKSHDLIRADTFDDLKSANDASIGKAKQMIDQMGDRLFIT